MASNMAAPRQEAKRIVEDYRLLTLPAKMGKLFDERFGTVLVYEPLKTREIALGITFLRAIEKDLFSHLDMIEKIEDDATLLGVLSTMKSRVEFAEKRSVPEMVELGGFAALAEELKLHKFGGADLDFLSKFSSFVLPAGSELVLSPDADDDSIYLNMLDKKVGWFEKRVHALDSADSLCHRHFPIVSASHNGETGKYDIVSMPISLEIPGTLSANPFRLLDEIFAAAKLDLEKLAERLVGILASFGMGNDEAMDALNDVSNYRFNFRSLRKGEQADGKNMFLATRMEAGVDIRFNENGHYTGRFGVGAGIILPERRVDIVSWSGTRVFPDENVQADLALGENGPSPGLGLGKGQQN